MKDETLKAALDHVRPSLMRRIWNWYKQVTGYEKAMLQRQTGLKIRSTCHEAKGKKPRVGSIIHQICA